MKKIALLFAATLALSACSGNETEKTAGSTSSKTTKENDVLTVYVNDFDEMIEPLFEEATDYDVEIVVGNGAEIQSRIESEKSNPNWDVVWMDGQASFSRWDDEGMFKQNLDLENKANLNDFGKELLPKTDAYYPTGAHAAGVIVYNTNEITAEEAPKTWEDLTDERFKDSVGMADPAVAAPAYPFVAWFFEEQGMDAGKEYFTKLFENGTKVYPKNPNVVEALLSGEIKVAALQESNAYKMVQDGEPVEIIWPEEGAPASVRYAAISSETDNEEAARAFINFLLEYETQKEMINGGTEGYFTSSVKDVESPDDRDKEAPLLIADPAKAAENEAEIKTWFSDQSVQ
ncbi:extracellular solute-binding protein [Metabacillus niabensis]|uniref:Iron(III) transport system substrate-binding protein n=1 Tax=Metabacillus niabensis TaxID=324854 RepID=A0ABT9Z2J5_9BACI|nr:extracellular solute-binding protein [Metabacillus niabensis]MDQ0226230.1 iron(III) transport system substrate-binding protein [Metabacillus niabensis]